MRRFLNLIINENIKIFAKTSTIIMLVIIVLLSVMWNLAVYSDYRRIQGNTDNFLDFDSLIEQNKDIEDQVNMYRFMKEIGITDGSDWRYDATQDITGELSKMKYELPSQEEFALEWYEKLKKTIRDNDPKAYLTLRMDYVKEDMFLTGDARQARLSVLKYALDNDIPPTRYDRRYSNLLSLIDKKAEFSMYESMPAESRDMKKIAELKNDIAVTEYVIEHNISTYLKPDKGDLFLMDPGFWYSFFNSTTLIMIINLLIIIVAGSIVSREFSSGTIKFLLINPIKRWKILMAKYLSVLLVGVAMLFIYYIFNFIMAGVFFGFKGICAPLITASQGVVKTGSPFLYVAWKYILGSVGVLTMATFAFMISTLVRNSSLAIGLGVFLLLSGYSATFMLATGFNMDWARYILFANIDINNIINNQTPFVGHTVGFALTVIAVYMVVFLLTAWDAFVRRDIK